jgi:hypothetical protein
VSKSKKTPTPSKTKTEKPNGMANHMYGRLLAIVKSHGANQSEEDFGSTAFVQMAPRNTAEALLVQQMIACHEVGLNMITRSKHSTSQAQAMETGNLAAKLLGLFERQFSALERARRPQQTVVVEHLHKHVHLNGQVPGPTGEGIKIDGQAHATIDARTLALAPSTPLLSQDAPRDPVPVASDEARPLPNARRRTRDRRPER